MRRIVAASKSEVYDSLTQLRYPSDALPNVIDPFNNDLSIREGFFVANDCYPYVAALNKQYGYMPDWVCRITARRKTVIRKDREIKVGTFIPIYFGFRNPSRHGKHKHRNLVKFYCLSTDNCMNKTQRSSPDYGIDELVEIMETILDLMERRTGNTSGALTNGSIATRLMKASKEWSRERKPAPKFINDFATDHLPGNHYSLSVPKGTSVRAATYLDQNNAHHSVAKSIPLPDPNSIRARGNYKSLEGEWIKAGTKKYERFTSQHIGLVAANVSVGNIPDKFSHLLPAFLRRTGDRTIFLYTNEWFYFEEWKDYCKVNHIVAGWTATSTDKLIPEYADWSLNEIGRLEGVGRRAAKSVLLSGYGMLATDPTKVSLNYYQQNTPKGAAVTIPYGGTVRQIAFRRRGFNQPSLRHTIARGLIEAETRKRSLIYASSLEKDFAIRTICVYADGIIVDTEALPFVPPGWKIESYLHNAHFLHPTAFTSQEVTKIPGLPLDTRNTIRNAERISHERRRLAAA